MMKLFQVKFMYWDDYKFSTSWCDDCPGRDSGCCKDDESNYWQTAEAYLELAPNVDIMINRVTGRRTPDSEYDNISVLEVPWRMWQRWDRVPSYVESKNSGLPVLRGDDFITRDRMQYLYNNGQIGL